MNDKTVTRQDVREWVARLTPGTFFHLDTVPEAAETKRVALSQMASMPNARLQRAARGIYQWTRYQDRDGRWLRESGTDIIIKLHVGKRHGSGWSSITALHRMNWANQRPLRLDVAVLSDRHGNIPRSPLSYVSYHRRSNHRRQILNWAEVSVLEGLRAYPIVGNYDSTDRDEWQRALRSFTSEPLWERYGSRVNLDRLEWAAETEPARHLDAMYRGLPAVRRYVERRRAQDAEAADAGKVLQPV